MPALTILYEIVSMIANVVFMLIIIQFIIGLLFSFNVIDGSNRFLLSFYDAINRLMEPVYRPIRRVMPATGAIDFSPLVLMILLNIVLIVLNGIMVS